MSEARASKGWDPVLRFGLIGLALAGAFTLASLARYPAENDYKVLRQSASYLGSFDPTRNPPGWWLFTIALVVIAAVLVRMTLARHRRIAAVVPAGWALKLATTLHLGAALAYALLGLIPDAKTASLGAFTFDDIHDRIAGLSFLVMALAIVTDALIFLLDYRANGHKHFDHRSIRWPFLAFTTIGVVGGGSMLTWYIRCELDSSLKHWPGEGIYCFPMWEWILIFFGPLFMTWLTWALGPRRVPAP